MTVMIESFFGVHPHLIRSGLWAALKPGAKDLYVFLMHESERTRSRELKRTDAQVRQTVGASGRTLCNARKQLQERGLIQCKRADGNKYIYTICDPVTGKPYPGDPRVPIRRSKAASPSYPHENQTPHRESQSLQADDLRPKNLRDYGLPGVFGH